MLLKEFYVDRKVPYFNDYLERYTDMPFLVELRDGGAGKYLRAGRLEAYATVEHPEWKLLVWDGESKRPRMPNGAIGHRWAEQEKGRWNLEMVDGVTGEALSPELSFLDTHDEVVELELDDFGGNGPCGGRCPPDGSPPRTATFLLPRCST